MGPHPRKYLPSDKTATEFANNITPRSVNPMPQPYPSAEECGSPLFHFTSDFYLTFLEPTNKQGTVSQIIPLKRSTAKNLCHVMTAKFLWIPVVPANYIPLSHGFVRISACPFPCNEILFDLEGPYVRILCHAHTFTCHECLGVGWSSAQWWKARHPVALQHYQVLR